MAKNKKYKKDFEEELEEFEDDTEDYEEEFDDEEEKEVKKEFKPIGFAYWNIGDKSYRLKLKTKQIEELENKYRTNLTNLMGTEAGMPPLKTMLDITHNAMKEWHHNVKYEHVLKLFDRYVDEGGSQLKFYSDVFVKIYMVSGFFPKEIAQEMSRGIEESMENL